MSTIVHALFPIFLLILVGYVLKRIRFAPADFWQYLDKFIYFILFPSLLLYKLAFSDHTGIAGRDVIVTAFISLLILSGSIIIYNARVPFENRAFTSVFQGTIRFNTYVFLALTDAILGDKGLVTAAFLISFVIPLINVLCIFVFTYYVPDNPVTFRAFFRSIFTNPLILACISGGILNFFNVILPQVFGSVLSLLSSAALPLGLLSVGVGLQLSTIRHAGPAIAVSSSGKLIILPLLMYAVAIMFGLPALHTAVLVLFAAMPTSASSYILARELGGDMKLISSIISVQTIVSIITISMVIQFIHIP